jgi:hypothetical protein
LNDDDGDDDLVYYLVLQPLKKMMLNMALLFLQLALNALPLMLLLLNVNLNDLNSVIVVNY